MTTITIDRAVVEQALHVAENAGYPLALIKALRDALEKPQTAHSADDLHDAARQALDDLRDLQANHNITYAGTISRLEAAPAQEQAEQTWVCPDSPEHRYKKPGHCEDCGRTLVLAQHPGCEHCRHPLYAATKCRVCGRVTEPKEPAYKTYPISMHFEWVGDRWLFNDNPIDSGEWHITLGDGGWMIYPKVEQAEPVQEPVGWLESPHGAFRADPLYKMQFPSQLLHWQIPLYTTPPKPEPVQEPVAWCSSVEFIDALKYAQSFNSWRRKYPKTDMPLYTAPPQRKPLPLKTVERLIYENTKINPNVADDRELLGYIVNAARAIERAHGIGDNT